MSAPKQRLKRTSLSVLGICCAAEVPLIKRILDPLPGVENVSVNFTARTVTILHNPLLGDGTVFAKVLNEARMEASIIQEHKSSERSYQGFWIAASGVFVAISLFQHFYSPLKWFAVAGVLVGVPRVALKALASLRRLILDINVLMLLAVIGALALANYIEAGSIVFLFSFADWLQTMSIGKARDALAFAVDLTPQTATLANSGLVVPLENVNVGSVISLRAGEMIPLDGVITYGETTVDESSLTGEARPSPKNVGQAVWAGTVNVSSYITMETTATAEDSALSRMIRMVEEAQAKKSHIECIVEKFAKYYTPPVLASAIATALIPLALRAGHEREWIYLALVLVVVACPCALVVSTPVTTTCSIVQGAKMGLIIKGGDCLETLAKLRVLAMDKTGTLTEGHFRVLDVFVVDDNVKKLQVLQWIMSLESKSIHPIANAVVRYARLHGAEQPSEDIRDIQTVEGEGISAIVDGHLVEIGNSRLAFRQNWTTDVEGYKREGASMSWVGVDGKHVAVFCTADKLRPEALEAVRKLKDMGIKPLILTGDNNNSAAIASAQLDDLEFHSELLPHNKVDILQRLHSLGTVGMVGDGVNDAPALAAADVGFAMGVAGSAIAMETADIALMTNDLRKVAMAVRLGQKHRLKIIQNIFASIFTKLAVAGLAVFGYAPLWLAVLADVGTCVLVTFNSMLLLLSDQDQPRSITSAPCKSSCCEASDSLINVTIVDIVEETEAVSQHKEIYTRTSSSITPNENSSCANTCCSSTSEFLTPLLGFHPSD